MTVPATSHPVVAKILRIERELNRYIIGRETEIRSSMLALVARQHLFLLSPPGAGKSLLSSEVCRRVRGAAFFKIELNPFTLPDALFGPISLKAMRERDALERRVEGFLPTADVAQLDEIWKCPPATLNTMLGLLNEREFRNDDRMLRVPLVSAFVTSNEMPPTDRSLDALYDRILLRHLVAPLVDQAQRKHATSFSLRMRAFETHARRVAGDLAAARLAGRDQAIATATEGYATFAAQLAAWQSNRKGQITPEAAPATDDAPLNEADRLVWAKRQSAEIDRQARDRLAEAERRRDEAIAAAQLTFEANRLRSHRPDRWLIDAYGELFSSARMRQMLSAGELTAFSLPAADDEAELLVRMVAWADEREMELPYSTFIERRDLDELHAMALEVTIPAKVEEVFYRVIENLSSVGVSVRREAELRTLIAASAVLDNRNTASVGDLAILKHALWDRKDDIEKVGRVVDQETDNIVRELKAIRETVQTWRLRPDLDHDDRTRMLKQMATDLVRFQNLASAHPENSDIAEALAEALAAKQAFQERIYDDLTTPVRRTTLTDDDELDDDLA